MEHLHDSFFTVFFAYQRFSAALTVKELVKEPKLYIALIRRTLLSCLKEGLVCASFFYQTPLCPSERPLPLTKGWVLGST